MGGVLAPNYAPHFAVNKLSKGIAAMGYKIEHKGKTVELPNFNDMPTGVLRKARHETESEQTWFILEGVLDDKQLQILDTLPLSEFSKHMKAWTGGVALGE